ncbi:MAG: SDR family oxidoreductase [Planctomycetota bacterium]|nr:SDR family oxidoreductase [Planctomycetota bacterium]
MDKPLKGKVALVTGSGRGLGYAIIKRLAELGADVAVHDISQEAPAEFGEAKNLDEVAEKLAALGVKAAAVTGTVAEEAAVKGFTAAAEKALGPLNVLVNCAGGDIAAKGGKPKPNNALGVPMEDVRAIFDRNLFGTVMVCKAVCPGMAERGTGSVINIGSGIAHYGVDDGVAYAVAKAAVVHWTRCLAWELRPHGVRVNAISPGPTMTARFSVTRALDPKMTDESVPLKRYGKPDEIADAVAFLAGDQSRFISAQVLRVDGGMFTFPA